MQRLRAVNPKLFVATAHTVGAMVVALSAGAIYFFVQRPLVEQQRSDEQHIEQLKELLVGEIEVRREHQQLKKEYETLKQRAEQTRESAPSTARESAFLADASRIANETDVDIFDFRRGRARHLPSHSEFEITLSGTGAYAGICNFLEKMNALPRAKRVTSLHIDTDDDAAAYPLEVTYVLYFGLEATTAGKPGAKFYNGS